MIYKNLFFIFITFFFSINQAMAENWVPIQSFNGKTAEIDIDSIIIKGEIVKFKIKQVSSDKIIVYNILTNFSNKTSAICDITITYNTGQKVFENYSKQLTYMKIKEDSLNATTYRLLSYLKTCNINSFSSTDELKIYLKKLQKKIQKHWHPNIIFHFTEHQPNEKAIAYVTLLIFRDGYTQCINYQNNTNMDKYYENFNENLKNEIMKYYKKHKYLEPLPVNFKGDAAIVVIRYEYLINNKMSINASSNWNNVGVGYIESNKKFTKAYPVLRLLLILPFEYVYSLFEEQYNEVYRR